MKESHAVIQDIRRVAAKLRRTVPPLLPVSVYIRRQVYEAGEMLWGKADLTCDGTRDKFRIYVTKSHPQIMRDTLMHEWAHCLAWEAGTVIGDDHGPAWGLAMSRVYSAVIDQ